MRTLLSLFALVGALLAGGLLTGCGGGAPDFGITAAEPVGSPGKIEAACTAKGLTKASLDPRMAVTLFGPWVSADETPGLTFTAFKDSVPGYVHHIVVVTGDDGKVKALAGEFRSGALVYSPQGTKVETMMIGLWPRLSGSKAVFEALFDGNLGNKEYFWAEFTKGKVHGTWRKDGQDMDMKNPRGVVDKIIYRVQ